MGVVGTKKQKNNNIDNNEKKTKMKMCVLGKIIKGQLRTVSSIRKCKGEFCKGHCFCFFVFFSVSFCMFCSINFVFLRFYVTIHYVLIVVHCGV
jgi:hypothetical protein